MAASLRKAIMEAKATFPVRREATHRNADAKRQVILTHSRNHVSCRALFTTFMLRVVTDAQTTAHAHPDRAYENIAHPMKRPADSLDEILFPTGMPRSHPRPQCRRSSAPSQAPRRPCSKLRMGLFPSSVRSDEKYPTSPP